MLSSTACPDNSGKSRHAGKNFLQSLLLFLLVTQFCSAQWFWQSPLPQGNDLEGVFSFDHNTAIAVGATGTIIKTTDGGYTWDIKNSGTKIWLRDVFFIDDQTGWVAGDHGLILKSSDGGETWITQNNTPIYSLNSIYFVNANIGFTVGTSGKILKTTDGGSTWVLSNFSSNTMSCVYFIDENNGWICGWFGSILKTIDGGNNWTPVPASAIDQFYSLSFTDALNGIAVGTGNIVRTIDGGLSWTIIQHAPFNSVCIHSSGKGWAVGMGRAYGFTSDGGLTWICEPGNGGYRHLESVSASDEYSVWMVGEFGNIFKSTSGLMNLIPVSTLLTDELRDVCFIDKNNGWIVGGRANPGDVLTIFKTTNGGIHWIPIDLLLDNTLFGVDFINENVGWAVGWGAGSNGLILKTINGGYDWSTIQFGSDPLYDVFFINDQIGWIAGDGGSILKTTNAGENWNDISSGSTSLSAIYFINENVGWAVGPFGKIIKTTDGGNSWENQVSGFNIWLADVLFLNENAGWIAAGSGLLLKTTDGGTTWEDQLIAPTTMYDFYSVYFIDSNNGCACGSYGIQMKTTDGGVSWIQEGPITHRNLNAVYFSDINTGFTVGDGGQILKSGQDINIGSRSHNNLNLSIADFNTAEDTIFAYYQKDFLDSYQLVDVEILLDTILHTSDCDLIITLTHSEITDTLVRNRGNDGDNFISTRLLDASLNLLESGSSPFAGDFKPESPLNTFAGLDPNGEWVLRIYDGAAENAGTFQAWGIKFYFESITGFRDMCDLIIDEFILHQNYPNPFNPVTTIRFAIPQNARGERQEVTLKVFDILGREVSTLVNEEKAAGTYEVMFNGNKFASGVYFYQLIAGEFIQTKKMLLLK
jgi:photosystem II stability/assembly factor-like uncharacterized protein